MDRERESESERESERERQTLGGALSGLQTSSISTISISNVYVCHVKVYTGICRYIQVFIDVYMHM
jgi:hypothetical protein